ncbi:amino acid adenylation domain-containing protein [Sphingomonas sp. CROZ-RG-20F-R02-07]|uniref:amino acid adenylation domain-containing protein n=1 Tax=Sphingomonas sp. CROZ-RG-20F-R02-07 TaxID=2914832 RepID=UPI001F574A9B|nr:amino acid adenylation domain-containing protein [Sphingomonas sp. CROZ-RG-20F-R02-07]
MARDDADWRLVANIPDRWSSIIRRFADRVAETPDAVAVVARGARATYAELAEAADRCARRIARHRPEGPDGGEMLVGLCLERTIDLPTWLLGVFQAGGAYVPLDPAQPAQRLRRIVEGASPAVVVVHRALADRLPPLSCPVIVVEDDADANAPPLPARATAPDALAPDALAYVMYTSGSTGQPKGVEIEHRGVVALLDSIAAAPGLVRGETLLAPTRIGFDLSVIDIFLPLIVGGTIVLLDLDEVADPRRLAAAIALHRPDLMQATPATWRALLDAGWPGLPGLRLLCGGEAMTRDLADRLLPRCAELWNVYGPTETAVWSTACRVRAGEGPVSIGRPIEGTTVRIADAGLAPVATGAVGEIVIAGPGVARGYRRDPDLSAKRFVTLENGARAYRTGDLGSMDGDGALYCLGRMDDQVKVRGFRIELGEVEAALAAHPDVAWAAARVWPDTSGENVLVGYVVSRVGGALPAAMLKAFLADRLPPYMVPGRLLPMVEMPLTPNRKIDRAALPNPMPSADVASPATIAGDASAEGRLAAIWSELLGIPTIGPADDFFDLGGYSLITVRLLRRIEQQFGRGFELSDLMQASTLAAMTDLVTGASPTMDGVSMLLNDGGDRPPLHWLDAGPLIRGMVRAMPPGQPVRSLNLYREDEADLGEGALTVADVARAAMARLLIVQPTGPYRIGGWCRWGVVAHELACQLREGGYAVERLVLLDAALPGMRLDRRLQAIVQNRFRPRWNASDAPPASFSERVEQATRRHRARPLNAATLLVLSHSSDAHAVVSRWCQTTPRLHVVRNDGDHESIVRHPYRVATAIAIHDFLSIADQADVH